MRDLLNTLVERSSFGVWDVVLAAVVLVVGWLASGWARRGVAAALSKWSGLGPGPTNLIARLVRYSILLLTIGIVLTVLGAPLQPVLAAVVIVGAVAFLALRGIAANFGAGLVIQARRPVRIGDGIEVEGISGRIIEMTGRSVLLSAADGRTVRLPNTMLLENPLWNASESGEVRNEVRLRVREAPDVEAVTTTVLAAVSALGHRSERPPEVFVHTVTPASIDVTVRFWSPWGAREHLRSAAVRSVSEALAAAGLVSSVSSDPPPSAIAVRDALD